MLMQVARQEAAAGPTQTRPQGRAQSAGGANGMRRSGSAGSALQRNPLRRSASLDGSDFGGRANGANNTAGMMMMNGQGHFQHGMNGDVSGHSPHMQGVSQLGLDGRPRSAEGVTGHPQVGDDHLVNAGGVWGSAHMGVGNAGAMRPGPLRQRQAQARAAAAAAQLHQQFLRRAAAATLQAHWRGWQHRRLARYLRARRKRAMRLDWLWHLEYVTNLMHWHEAAHTVQAHWRGRRDPKRVSLPEKSTETTSTATAEKVTAGAKTATGPSLPSPPPSETEETAGEEGKEGASPAAAMPVAPASAASSEGAPSGSSASSSEAATSGAKGGAPSATAAKAGAAKAASKASTTKRVSVGAASGERQQGQCGQSGGRLTVHWREELAEVRSYNVVPPVPPRW